MKFSLVGSVCVLVVALSPALRAQQDVPADQSLVPCLAAAADEQAIWPTTHFPAAGKRLTCVFRLGEGDSFNKLTAIWTAVDVGDAAPANTEIARGDLALRESKRGRLRYTQDGPLPVGAYRLDVLADGEPWQSVDLEVVEDEPVIALDQPSELFPLTKGQRWRYAFLQEAGPAGKLDIPVDQLDDRGRLSATVTMSVGEQQEPGRHVRVERDGQLMTEEWWTLDEKGLAATQRRVSGELIQLDPPQPLLPLPERVPMFWTYQTRGARLDQQGQLWGPLPIAGPDGEQPGYLVVIEQGIPMGRMSAERRFIPGVGMTREVITTSMAGQMVSRQEMTLQRGADAQTRRDDYFPAAVGHAWIYDAQRNGEPARMTRTITGTEEIGGRSFYIMQQEGVAGVEPIHVHVSADGVHLLDAATRDSDPSMQLWVKLPLTPGETWTEKSVTRLTSTREGTNAPGRAPPGPPVTFTVKEPEQVEVPAGTFQATPIRAVSTLGENTEMEMANWFAPGVGEVKRTIRVTQGENVTFELNLALREFRPATEAPDARGDADPGAPQAKSKAYYPLAVGHTWVYVVQEDGRASEVTKKVTGLEKVGDRQAYVVRHDGLPGLMRTLHLHQTPAPPGGVQLLKARFELREPVSWVRYPLRTGDTWSGRLLTADGQDGGTLSFTVEATEKVTVPAGTFDAVRIRMDGETHGPSLQSRVWLAPDVGEVKRTVRLTQGEQVISESTLTLKQFQTGDG